MSVAGEAALESLTQEIQYMFATKEQGIRYRLDGHDQRLTTKYDAAFDPEKKDGKSMRGYIVLYNKTVWWVDLVECQEETIFCGLKYSLGISDSYHFKDYEI
jgi:hypothetical protein